MPLGVSVGFEKLQIARHHATFAHSGRELFDLVVSACRLVIHFGLERDPFTHPAAFSVGSVRVGEAVDDVQKPELVERR